MKRLMVALASVATAFGLYAADDGFKAGTGFEDGQGPAETAWTLPTGDNTLTVTAYADGEDYKGDVPAQYADDKSNAKYLAVKTTFGDPLKLNVSEATMGGIYFDSLVKFTACDEDPAADSYAGAKLVVYTKEIEGTDPVETRLFVKGGQLTGDGTTVTPVSFDCGKWTKGDAWVRLTIKSIANIAKTGTVPGFVVFIDGTPVPTTDKIIADDATVELNDIGTYWNTWNSAKCLIPSLIQAQDTTYGSEVSAIASAGFDGQGAIDDLAFTTTVPTFCADPAFFTFTWDENVAGVSYVLDDAGVVTLTPDQVAKGSIAIAYVAQETCTITVTPKAGFVIDSWTGDPDVDGNVGTFALPLLAGGVTTKANEPKATITINGVAVTDPICSVADAIAVINGAADDAKVVMTLIKDMEAGLDGETTEFTINSSAADVTIDLAGKTITGTASYVEDALVTAMSDLTIIDSVGGGKIVADPAIYTYGAVSTFGGDITIGAVEGDEGATVEGGVSAADGDTLSIVRGKFDGDEAPAEEYIAESSECSTEKDSDGYWVVAPKAVEKHGWAIYLAKGANENEFLISSEADLIALATWANKTDEDGETFPTKDITFTQTADITLTAPFAGIGLENGKDSVTTTDFDDAAFQGTYDGAGFQITGLQLTKGAKSTSHDYAGLFNSIYQATIKNVTVGISGTGWAGDAPADGKEEWAGAPIVGVCKASMIENCSTLEGTFKAKKAASGIASYVTGGSTLKACTNNLNIVSEANEKAAGLIACVQKAVGDKTTVVIEDCANYGDVTEASGKARVAGFASYTENNKVIFKGTCVFDGTLYNGEIEADKTHGQSVINCYAVNSFEMADGAVIKVPAKYATTVPNPSDGLFFATVAGNVATLVKNAAVVAGGSYKVMANGAPAITLAKIGDEITLDTSLFTATVKTSAEKAYVAKDGNKYTVTAKTDYSAAVLALASETAEWTDKLAFPTYTVKVGDVDVPTTAYTVGWNPKTIAEMKAGDPDATYTLTVTFTAGEAVIIPDPLTKTFKVTAPAPAQDLPSDVAGGSDQQKADYAKWAKEAGVSGTGNENAAAFALGVTAAEIQAAGDVTKAVQAKLDAEITSEMVAALVAGTDGQGLADLKAKYPNADFEFVPATELTSTDTAKFFKLQVSFKPAN